MPAGMWMVECGAGRLPSVYLHSTWRCASTYVWAKFRALDGYRAYFEPLSEHLVDATPEFIDRFAPWAYANHPDLERPYLDEFRPLLAAGGGVADFPGEFAFGRYRCDRATPLPRLAGYFERLERAARHEGRVPAFGCVRTMLRVDWFRGHLSGVHILVRRDHRRQFLSCLAQAAKGNLYFLERGLTILDSNRADPAIAAVARAAGLSDATGSYRRDFFEMPNWPMRMGKLYEVSYGLHRLAGEQARAADLVLDIDHLSTDRAARRDAEDAIAALTGTRIAFTDCRATDYQRQLAWAEPFFAAIEAEVDAGERPVPDGCPAAVEPSGVAV